MRQLGKPFLVVASLFVCLFVTYLILSSVNAGKQLSVFGQVFADTLGAFPVDVPFDEQPTLQRYLRRQRLYRIAFFTACWLMVLLIAISIWAWVYQVPGFWAPLH